ncbi:MAG: tRNA (N6-isopentenyl adenosine(37)-C2)-methylthiotransferase MiaB, partial [bacterium]|nr:tRNA (N6-isopentenyl adenosine(37)-C2)-methylthiotransferase MiaB [bacterium]
MKYHIITYGCQMNKSDSERIAAMLEKIGYKKATGESRVDLIILNTCSVRQTAVDRIYGKINQIRIKNKELRIILTGCILPEDKKKLQDKADLILDIRNLPEWPIFFKKILNSQYAIRNSKIKKNRNHD